MSDRPTPAEIPGEQFRGQTALPGVVAAALDAITGGVRRRSIDRSARGRWPVPSARVTRLRIFRPAAEPATAARALPCLYWRIDGHRVEVALYHPSDEPPGPDCQRHQSSGIWVSVRLA